MATSTPVLDLTTVAPTVSIDGDDYPLRVRDDLSILTNTDTAKKFARIEFLRVKGDRSTKEERELSTLLAEVCGLVLQAPASVLDKLSQFQRLSVVTAFFQQVAIANPTRGAHRPTSKKSPRD